MFSSRNFGLFIYFKIFVEDRHSAISSIPLYLKSEVFLILLIENCGEALGNTIFKMYIYISGNKVSRVEMLTKFADFVLYTQ